MGGSNHHCNGEVVEWRPPLLYAYPLSHCIPANLKIPGKTERHHTTVSVRCTRSAMRGARGAESSLHALQSKRARFNWGKLLP